jgi:hypothetical protein
MPVTRALPFSWYDTPNVRFGSFTDFEALAAQLGLRVRESFGLRDGERVGRRWANLSASVAVFCFEGG